MFCPGDLINNLNTPNSKDQQSYTKNIPHVDSEFRSVSGEEVGWSEMNRLIQQVAAELEMDAEKAIVGLREDEQLWDRLGKLKKKRRSSSTEQYPESCSGGTQGLIISYSQLGPLSESEYFVRCHEHSARSATGRQL